MTANPTTKCPRCGAADGADACVKCGWVGINCQQCRNIYDGRALVEDVCAECWDQRARARALTQEQRSDARQKWRDAKVQEAVARLDDNLEAFATRALSFNAFLDCQQDVWRSAISHGYGFAVAEAIAKRIPDCPI